MFPYEDLHFKLVEVVNVMRNIQEIYKLISGNNINEGRINNGIPIGKILHF